MMTLDLTHLIAAAVGAALAAAGAYVASGKPPVLDPENKRPAFDLMRDAVRAALTEFHAQQGGTQNVPPAPPTAK